jgi:glycosyltransferase involved in cell wall biosynthesis
MKKALIILFLVSLSSCFITESTGYIDYRQRRMYDWDPIYYVPNYIDPFFYRREPIIIYRDRYVPSPRQPQQPRRSTFAPSVPQPRKEWSERPNQTPPQNGPRIRTAPIREFPRKKISDFKD